MIIFLICGGCKKNAIENRQEVLTIETKAQPTYLSLVGEITLELPEAGPGLGIVGSITVVKDYIIVLDGLRKSVDVFDIAGNYRWSIGSRGDGKGKYNIPREPTIIPNTDQILIYDAGTGNILHFSIEGEYIGRVKLPEKRFINRMLVSEDHNLIYTYVDRNRNGILCVTSLDTGKDRAKFKVSDSQYHNLFFFLGRMHGLAFCEAQEMLFFALPWEKKVIRIDLKTQGFLTPITINHPKFVSLKLDEIDDSKDVRKLSQHRFSRLSGMYLLSSGDILLRYMFKDSSMSTALILLSDLDMQSSAQEVKNELGYNSFTSHGMSVYEYLPPADNEDTNGRMRYCQMLWMG